MTTQIDGVVVVVVAAAVVVVVAAAVVVVVAAAVVVVDVVVEVPESVGALQRVFAAGVTFSQPSSHCGASSPEGMFVAFIHKPTHCCTHRLAVAGAAAAVVVCRQAERLQQ